MTERANRNLANSLLVALALYVAGLLFLCWRADRAPDPPRDPQAAAAYRAESDRREAERSRRLAREMVEAMEREAWCRGTSEVLKQEAEEREHARRLELVRHGGASVKIEIKGGE